MSAAALAFAPPLKHKPGLILALLTQSYRPLLDSDPEHWQPQVTSWGEFDNAVFAEPDTVGVCVFVTCLVGKPIGFGSFEPGDPTSGWVGHNCILPAHRGRGYGKLQLEEIVRRMRARGITEIRVTTCSHSFFAPALRMYRSAGFVEVGRRQGGPDPNHVLIDLSLP